MSVVRGKGERKGLLEPWPKLVAFIVIDMSYTNVFLLFFCTIGEKETISCSE